VVLFSAGPELFNPHISPPFGSVLTIASVRGKSYRRKDSDRGRVPSKIPTHISPP